MTQPTEHRMISRLLVANRGEIARRVFATCRRLGIETVAVHSDADAGLPFVADADLAVNLPGKTPAETYLDGAAIIAAAERAGADAIHPGYGFLAESTEFARAVEAAGLTWVGPSPESIETMGSKLGAKALMKEAGVPVLEAPESPVEADLPLIVKASAGGGGRGMRVVRELSRLEAEVAAAASEATSAFGDGTVFVEPYVEQGRHVEVQVVGDGRGEVLVLGERDCSVQRRHQKVVEEAPAPGLTDSTRSALHESARAAAAAIDYRGAGTVEFLYDAATERFFFLEMNTRLQVEHPVTELTHGLDLVELQIAIAEGRDLPDSVSPSTGHAIEVRLYAEDPAQAYQPQSGVLAALEIDAETEFDLLTQSGVRLDAGFVSGSEVSTFYDAMLAKVIAWAPTREQAIRRLTRTLRSARLHGLTTNRDQLLAVLADPTFRTGEMTTALLDNADLSVQRESDPVAACVAAVAIAEHDRARRTVQQGVPVAWRNVVSQAQITELRQGADEIAVTWLGGRTGYHFPERDLEVVAAGERRVRVRNGAGVETAYDVLVSGGRVHVDHPGGSETFEVVPRFTDPAAELASGSLVAPMPGAVVSVVAAPGDRVRAGDPILVLEAMKMQHTVTAPTDGTVTEITVQPGAQVAAGDVMAIVEEDDQ